MLLPSLREQVLEANLELVRRGLVLYTFGNASGVSRDDGLVVIKPSGVPYDVMKPAHLVVTDLDGKVVEGDLRPSSDLPTHIALYRAFQGIAVLRIPTPSMPQPGRKPACRFLLLARRTPTIFTGQFRSPRSCRITRSRPTTSSILDML